MSTTQSYSADDDAEDWESDGDGGSRTEGGALLGESTVPLVAPTSGLGFRGALLDLGNSPPVAPGSRPGFDVPASFRGLFQKTVFWHETGDAIPHPLRQAGIHETGGPQNFRFYKQYHVILNTCSETGACGPTERQAYYEYLRPALVRLHADTWTKIKLRLKNAAKVLVTKLAREIIFRETKGDEAQLRKAAAEEHAMVWQKTFRGPARKLLQDSAASLTTCLLGTPHPLDIPASASLAWAAVRAMVDGVRVARMPGVPKNKLDSTTLSPTALSTALILLPFILKGFQVRAGRQHFLPRCYA